MYQLTNEGKEYLENGLPEKRLLLKLKTPKSIKELKGEQIAIGWAKKNRWIQIKQGKLELTDKGKEVVGNKIKLEESLEEVNSSNNTTPEFLKILLSRKLVEEIKDKKEFTGKEISQITPDIIINNTWKKVPFKKYDINAPAPKLFPGKKQAYKAFLDTIKRELVALGFKEMTGSVIESNFFNCDALYMPQDHPARGIHDIYSLKGKADLRLKELAAVKKMHEKGGFGSKGWNIPFSEEISKQLVLRSQGTSLSARTLVNLKKGETGKFFALARCYRPDVIDATHLTEFNQLEGIVVGKDVNFRQLLGLLSDFAKKIANTDKVKFSPVAYFPFTEPSVTGYIYHDKIKKWIEVMPAGIFRPEVTKPLGVDAPVLAWGLGVDRLFMIREGITDIRQLFSYDLNWLREAKI